MAKRSDAKSRSLSDEASVSALKQDHWSAASSREDLTEPFIRENADKLDWKRLSRNPSLLRSPALLEEYADRIDWQGSSERPDLLDISSIRVYCERLDWGVTSDQAACLSNEVMNEFADRLDWDKVSKSAKLDHAFVSTFADRLNWDTVSREAKLGDVFFFTYADRLDWASVSRNASALQSETFLRRYAYRLDWGVVDEELWESVDRDLLSDSFYDEFFKRLPRHQCPICFRPNIGSTGWCDRCHDSYCDGCWDDNMYADFEKQWPKQYCRDCADDEFVDNIKRQEREYEEKSRLKETSGQRRDELTQALEEQGVKLPRDSKLCSSYIDCAKGEITEIVKRECQMKYLLEYCNMLEVLKAAAEALDEALNPKEFPDCSAFRQTEDKILRRIGGYPSRWPWVVDYEAMKRERAEINAAIMSAVYHPDRIAKWLAAGHTVEDYLN